MDREILFRGERIDNGEWVEGYYAVIGKRNVIIALPEMYYTEDAEERYGNEIHDIVPETVCQYTGCTDFRQKKVFEHDVVFYEYGGCCGHIVFKEERFLIEWEEARTDLRSDIHFWFENRRMYVTSNIFDNPELLEGGAG